MPTIAFDQFGGGLDRRNSQSMSAANILWVLSNAYITTGKKIRKRPCPVLVATLEAGTKGLKGAGGVLNTFYGQGTITHANPLFLANKVAHPTLVLDVSKAHFAETFNGFLYASVEYTNGDVRHHYLDGSPATHIADTNCPNSKQVRKLSQKIYAARGEDVGFCKTADPRDWTTANDAGTIAAGTNASGSAQVTALGDFKGDLGIFFADGTQVWDVSADPADNALKSTAENVGTSFYDTPAAIAGDLVFLAKSGFRSISVLALTNNLQENDVGSAIDALRSEIADTDEVHKAFYPTLGQLWEINGDTAYVYSFARSVKLSAWAKFSFPFTIDAAATLANELYLRSGDSVYRIDPTAFADQLTADKLAEDATLNAHALTYSLAKAAIAIEYTYSVKIKSTERHRVILQLQDGVTAWATTLFDTESGEIESINIGDATIEPDADGYYRCSVSGLSTTGAIVLPIVYLLDEVSINGVYTGVSGSGVFLAEAQLEVGLVPTEYEETGAAAGVKNLLTFSNRFNQAPWVISNSTITPDVAAGPSDSPLVEVEMYYQDNKKPGELKMFTGFDGVVRGSPEIAFRFDPRNTDLITAFFPISGDMRPGDLHPMELCATSVAPVFRHRANEEFQIDQLLCHYENLGVF